MTRIEFSSPPPLKLPHCASPPLHSPPFVSELTRRLLLRKHKRAPFSVWRDGSASVTHSVRGQPGPIRGQSPRVFPLTFTTPSNTHSAKKKKKGDSESRRAGERHAQSDEVCLWNALLTKRLTPSFGHNGASHPRRRRSPSVTVVTIIAGSINRAIHHRLHQHHQARQHHMMVFDSARLLSIPNVCRSVNTPARHKLHAPLIWRLKFMSFSNSRRLIDCEPDMHHCVLTVRDSVCMTFERSSNLLLTLSRVILCLLERLLEELSRKIWLCYECAWRGLFLATLAVRSWQRQNGLACWSVRTKIYLGCVRC